MLAIAAGATRCGMRDDKVIGLWAQDLGQKARARIRCQHYAVPNRTVIREVLTRVYPDALDRALQRWNVLHATTDEGLAIGGKTRGNAIDALLTQHQHAACLIDHNAHCDFIS